MSLMINDVHHHEFSDAAFQIIAQRPKWVGTLPAMHLMTDTGIISENYASEKRKCLRQRSYGLVYSGFLCNRTMREHLMLLSSDCVFHHHISVIHL
jgi:hypothetical protein